MPHGLQFNARFTIIMLQVEKDDEKAVRTKWPTMIYHYIMFKYFPAVRNNNFK